MYRSSTLMQPGNSPKMKRTAMYLKFITIIYAPTVLPKAVL
jgi:hypothetical protein